MARRISLRMGRYWAWRSRSLTAVTGGFPVLLVVLMEGKVKAGGGEIKGCGKEGGKIRPWAGYSIAMWGEAPRVEETEFRRLSLEELSAVYRLAVHLCLN